MKILLLFFVAIYSNVALAVPFTQQEIREGIERGLTFAAAEKNGENATSFDDLLCMLNIPNFNFSSGRFEPRPGLVNENLEKYKELGEDDYSTYAEKQESKHSLIVIHKDFVGKNRLPVMFVYTLNEIAKPGGGGLGNPRRPQVETDNPRIRVYNGHDESILSQEPVDRFGIDGTIAIANLIVRPFINRSTKVLDGTNVHIDWIATNENFRRNGIAEALTQRVVALFQNHTARECTISMSARSDGSKHMAEKLGWVYFGDGPESCTLAEKKHLKDDTNYYIDLKKNSDQTQSINAK